MSMTTAHTYKGAGTWSRPRRKCRRLPRSPSTSLHHELLLLEQILLHSLLMNLHMLLEDRFDLIISLLETLLFPFIVMLQDMRLMLIPSVRLHLHTLKHLQILALSLPSVNL
jgi:hypothetical protein